MERKALYDRIYACWLGKNIGGTLGTPVEGCKEVMHLDWYPRLDPHGALPNDDLDLQLVNLHAMEQEGVRLGAEGIAAEWTEHVYFPWDEYGYSGTAMRMGFKPPFSGMFDNTFTDCMGSPHPLRNMGGDLRGKAAPCGVLCVAGRRGGSCRRRRRVRRNIQRRAGSGCL